MILRRPGLAVALATTVGLAGCHHEGATTAQAVSVTIRVARPDTLRDTVTAAGTIVPSSAGDWTVYAQEPGHIAELPKKEQDTVASGDVLVRFDVPAITQDMAAKQLAVMSATQRVDDARAAVARQSGLFDRGLAPRNTVDSAKIEQSAAERALSDATTLFQTTKALSDQTVIRARFSGIVLKVWHAAGDQIPGSPTDPIMRIVDPTHVQVEAAIPATQLGRIFPGQLATVHAAPGDEGQPATVLTKTLPATPGSTDGQVRLSFSTPSTLAIDAPVTVELVLGERANAIFVPSSAVLRDANGSYVMVAGDDERAHRRDVRLGLITKDVVQLAAGISPGERVIVGGLNDVTDNAPIQAAP